MTMNKRSLTRLRVLKREGKEAASHEALSRHAQEAARARGPKNLKLAALKAARTRKHIAA
ncbi:MAG: hypothetical protein HYR96_06505 [Deltaproteobacteria bacterium]|nr:hypothetical protein [Deltaproteobacteria bacterium]MBI3295875.1 hypothetical protein [Deltaproteobacteria bacterium]